MSVHRQTSESRKRYFLSLIASLNGEDLAFVCGNDQDVMMLVRRGAGSTAMVQAVNLNLDPIRTLRLRVPRKASVSVLASHGKWNELDSSFDGEFVSIDVSIAFCEAKTFKIKMEE
jgi:hypothetical protein